MKRLLVTLAALLMAAGVSLTTAPTANADLTGYWQVRTAPVGAYGQLELWFNGSAFKARTSHIGASRGAYAWTDVWICGTAGGATCFTGINMDGGQYRYYAGDVYSPSSCVRANGRIDYRYHAEATILFCR